jgi:hypothetical protein
MIVTNKKAFTFSWTNMSHYSNDSTICASNFCQNHTKQYWKWLTLIQCFPILQLWFYCALLACRFEMDWNFHQTWKCILFDLFLKGHKTKYWEERILTKLKSVVSAYSWTVLENASYCPSKRLKYILLEIIWKYEQFNLLLYLLSIHVQFTIKLDSCS